MKDIKDMNLRECIESLRDEYNYARGYYDSVDGVKLCQLADRIHDLTRWIPVEERLPTESDAQENGYVEFWDARHRLSYYYKYNFIPQHYEPYFTHWKRITPPEDKL